MNRERLVAKLFYKVDLTNITAFSIGGYDSFSTDHDIVVDSNDTPYVPATAIAGSIFSALSSYDENILTDFSINRSSLKKGSNNISQSSLFVSDGEFENKPDVMVRDGIALDYESKQTKNTAKYDYQIVPQGNNWSFRFEITLRESDLAGYLNINELIEQYKNNVKIIISLINSGQIRIGYKTRRGLGLQKVNNVYFKEFYGDTLKDLISFDYKNYDIFNNYETPINSRISICAPLKIESGFICRTYFDGNNEIDYGSLKENEKYIIPGSSIAGALTSEVYKLLKKSECVLDQVDFENNFVTKYLRYSKDGASKLIVSDAIIENASNRIYTRSAVDRFSGAAKEGALFSEAYVSKGNVKLKVEFDENTDGFIVGLYYLAIDRLSKGLITIGGQESIGRGHFLLQENEEISLSNKEQYIDELMKYVSSKGED